MRTSKRKANEPDQSVTDHSNAWVAVRSETNPPTRPRDLYDAWRGGGMALSEWLKAEQELKRKLGARTANSQSPPSPVCFQNEVGESASTFGCRALPPGFPGNLQLVNPACAGIRLTGGMTLNDWRDVEQEVKRKLENE